VSNGGKSGWEMGKEADRIRKIEEETGTRDIFLRIFVD
jgi:hypothetical protein